MNNEYVYNKLGHNRYIWENKAYPLSNTSIYIGVCHKSVQNERIALAVRVASTTPTGSSWIHHWYTLLFKIRCQAIKFDTFRKLRRFFDKSIIFRQLQLCLHHLRKVTIWQIDNELFCEVIQFMLLLIIKSSYIYYVKPRFTQPFGGIGLQCLARCSFNAPSRP